MYKKKNQKLFFGNQSKQVQTEPGDGAGGGGALLSGRVLKGVEKEERSMLIRAKEKKIIKVQIQIPTQTQTQTQTQAQAQIKEKKKRKR